MLAPIFAAILPFLLWPVEFLLPYPVVVEELAKLLLVVYILNDEEFSSVKIVIVSGILFSITESVLYVFDILSITESNFALMFTQRLLMTGVMHTLTMVVMFVLIKKDRRLLPVGLGVGMIIHFVYNSLVASIF